jgi:UDP-glucose 4-epimerase
VKLVRGDVLDAEALRTAASDADIVVHMASIAGVDTVLKNPVLTMKVSLLGTYNALQAAWPAGATSASSTSPRARSSAATPTR